MSTSDHQYYNALNLIPQMGPLRFKKLYNNFPSMKDVWSASASDLERAGIEKDVIGKIIEGIKNISPEKEFEKLEKEGVKIATINDAVYPERLKEIHGAPALLYFRGEIIKDEYAIAIVGSRKISVYGRQAASQFARELAEAGITVISGLALGVDSIAHEECLKLKKRTIAILGGGINKGNIYPSNNRQIADEIVLNGAIISEYPIGTPPLKQHFPARNRIISGLSLGTLVIEASESSGALITAKFALEQNREVFAVPGNIFSKNSEGTNSLIKLGAKLVTKTEDILEELNLRSVNEIKTAREIIPDNNEEKIILECLSKDVPVHVDSIAKISKMNNSAVSGLLTLMEIKGKVKNVGGMRYVIAN